MNKKERIILMNCKQALLDIPHQRNKMSARGAGLFDKEMGEALGIFSNVVYDLVYGDTNEAYQEMLDLLRFVKEIRIKEELLAGTLYDLVK
jgi:hypothetical protein